MKVIKNGESFKVAMRKDRILEDSRTIEAIFKTFRNDNGKLVELSTTWQEVKE